jgi:hypothetical protein
MPAFDLLVFFVDFIRTSVCFTYFALTPKGLSNFVFDWADVDRSKKLSQSNVCWELETLH